MRLKSAIMACLLASLVACSSANKEKLQYELSVQNAIANRAEDNAANEAGAAIAQSLQDLNQLDHAATPNIQQAKGFDAAKYNMARLSSVDWSGPIEPLLQDIAMLTDYKFTIIGRQPAIPVIVAVSEKNVMIGKIFENIVSQVQSKAEVNLYAQEKLIELVYK